MVGVAHTNYSQWKWTLNELEFDGNAGKISVIFLHITG